jgi:hypothetical protein
MNAASTFRQGLNAGCGCCGCERASPSGRVSSSRAADPNSPRRKPTPARRARRAAERAVALRCSRRGCRGLTGRQVARGPVDCVVREMRGA